MKIWVTRYALTRGILQVEAEVDAYFARYRCPGSAYSECVNKGWGDYSLTLEDAKKRAEVMRGKRIKVLQQQIEKLRKLGVEGIPVKEWA